MIKRGDIFKYTVIMGGDTKYYVEEVYEAQDEWMVITSYENPNSETGFTRYVDSLETITKILQSGHIKIIGHDNHRPITFIRPHSFNPKLRNIPMRRDKLICPYRTPKLYEHE